MKPAGQALDISESQGFSYQNAIQLISEVEVIKLHITANPGNPRFVLHIPFEDNSKTAKYEVYIYIFFSLLKYLVSLHVDFRIAIARDLACTRIVSILSFSRARSSNVTFVAIGPSTSVCENYSA